MVKNLRLKTRFSKYSVCSAAKDKNWLRLFCCLFGLNCRVYNLYLLSNRDTKVVFRCCGSTLNHEMSYFCEILMIGELSYRIMLQQICFCAAVRGSRSMRQRQMKGVRDRSCYPVPSGMTLSSRFISLSHLRGSKGGENFSPFWLWLLLLHLVFVRVSVLFFRALWT